MFPIMTDKAAEDDWFNKESLLFSELCHFPLTWLMKRIISSLIFVSKGRQFQQEYLFEFEKKIRGCSVKTKEEFCNRIQGLWGGERSDMKMTQDLYKSEWDSSIKTIFSNLWVIAFSPLLLPSLTLETLCYCITFFVKYVRESAPMNKIVLLQILCFRFPLMLGI